MIRISWSEGRWFPTLIKGGAMGLVCGTPVYACGMTQPWRETELAWYYELGKGDWMPAAPIPAPRCYSAGCTAGDGMIVAGGRKAGQDGLRILADVWELKRNGESWAWTELPPLNQARGVAGLAASGTKVLAVGGGDWERVHSGAFTAELVTKAELLDRDHLSAGWRALEPPFSPRAGCAAAAVGGKVYVFGGYTCWVNDGRRSFAYFDEAYAFDVRLETWTQLPPSPCSFSGHAAVAWGDRYIILLGGVCRYDLCGQQVTQMSVKMDAKRKLLTGEYSDLVWVYDTVEDTYALLEEHTPHGLNDIRACINGDTIYVVGGENVDPSTSNTTDYVMVGTVTA